MIQDIYPHRFYNEYHPKKTADDESIILSFEKNNVLIQEDRFPKAKDFDVLDYNKLIYLFSIDEENDYFLCEQPESIPDGYHYADVKELRNHGEYKKYRMFVAYTAMHLSRWYRNNRFCGRCGGKTYLDDKERALRCNCGNIIYPKVVPAVIVGVLNNDKMLVTKYRVGYSNYALVAGFTEIGETLEETVAREVMEEVGLQVKNIRYYKSQPWGVADDILAGFYCEVDGDDEISMDEEELKVAKWVTRDEIELQPDEFSLTNEMMKRFKEGLE